RKARPFPFAACAAMAGVYVLLTTRGAGYAAGGVFLMIAGLMAHDAYRRLRFPTGQGGRGMVEIDERRITYFTAQGGGSISLDDVTRIEAHRNRRCQVTWVFYASDDMLSVPANAMGSDALFDAFVALPGINHAQAQAAASGEGPDVFLIWQKDRSTLH
ncbi:MAG: hypothetical protein AAF701_09965, partial [Pseudomonadota bacterium]